LSIKAQTYEGVDGTALTKALRSTDDSYMTSLLVNWLLSALSLVIVANVIRGFQISGFGAALIAAIVIGFVNGTLGFLLKIVTFPLSILTLGIFWIVINALMLKVAAALVPGFRIDGFLPAFFGAIVLSLVNMLLRYMLGA
jgi:putative membrane protein